MFANLNTISLILSTYVSNILGFGGLFKPTPYFMYSTLLYTHGGTYPVESAQEPRTNWTWVDTDMFNVVVVQGNMVMGILP